ncbi:MAG: exo-alpha-sialidase [Deltaproteobacteria bacterium]|nr:exo-alpha-sialidase [Deltaproteobacteria bacterium]
MTELLVSTRKGLFVVEGHGAEARVARTAFLGDNVTLAFVDRRDATWYAVLDHGHFGVKLHRSDDRGATWMEIATPAYPPKPEGLVDKDMWGKDREWSTKGIWALEAAPDRDGALWCGTLPGGLFRSEDRGATWTLCEALWTMPNRLKWNGGGADHAAIHSICVDPRDPRTVVVAVSSGGVWRTRDAGATWDPHTAGMVAGYVPPEQADWPENQDPHCVVQAPSAPNVFWCQHHMGIWRSTDDLATWTQLHAQPSSFGFPVAVHPGDADTAWFVPAHSDQKRAPIDGRVVVTRTRDGGATFHEVTAGLPQQHAYDLVYRHALSIAPDGDQLGFGSTTGNLWVTADQGDHWHAVAANLPPIYAVRYA